MTSKHFLDGLDRDIQENLVRGLREEWTHHSTGLEGNSLTLGETAWVLAEGLTIDGKPIKDHNEVIGHGKAVDWAVKFAQSDPCELTTEDLFDLHKLVQTERIIDTFKPYGNWKVEPNGTMVRGENGNMEYIEFAIPVDVPFLMEKWLRETNVALNNTLSEKDAPTVFCGVHTGFVSIHPFWDGNGRMSRIVANLPLLRAGFPPIVVRKTHAIRTQYISLLQMFQRQTGRFTRENAPLPIPPGRLSELTDFFQSEWQHTLNLVKQAHQHQKTRV